MAEYMDYDDSLYEGTDHTLKQKIKSWISIGLSVIVLATIVIYVFVRAPQTIRANFDTVTGQVHTVGQSGDIEKNEFYILNSTFEKGDTIKVNSSFKKNYPNTYELISQSLKSIARNKVFSYDDGSAMTVAQAYIVTRSQTETTADKSDIDGVIGTDIAVIPYSSDKNGKITIGNPIRFSLKYYNESKNGVNYVAGTYVKTDSFKMNFRTLSVKIKSGKGENIKSLDTILNLNGPLTKKESENNILYDSISMVTGDKEKYSLKAHGKRGDYTIEKTLAAADDNSATTATVRLDFNDTIYRKFSSFDISAGNTDEFTILVN